MLVNAADRLDIDTARLVAEGSNGVFVESLQGEVSLASESEFSLDIGNDVSVTAEKEVSITSSAVRVTFERLLKW